MSRYEQAADGAQNACTEAASQGPPGDLPGGVPEFVGGVHSAISGYLGGGIESLGDAVSGIASGGGAGDVATGAAEVAMAVPLSSDSAT